LEQALRQGTDFYTTQPVAPSVGCKHSVKVHFYRELKGMHLWKRFLSMGKMTSKARQLANVVMATTLVLNIPLSGRTSSLAVNLIPFPSCTETRIQKARSKQDKERRV